MDKSRQRIKQDSPGTKYSNTGNSADSLAIDEFTQIPLSLHNYIAEHKEAIGTGLYYLSLGNRSDTETEDKEVEPSLEKKPEEKEAQKTLRFKLSPLAQAALTTLMNDGKTKKAAVIAAINYLKNKPSTLLEIHL